MPFPKPVCVCLWQKEQFALADIRISDFWRYEANKTNQTGHAL
jgi:hypothetical protein